jgi:hypothetical protein
MMRAMSPFLVSTWPTNPPDRCKSLGSALIVTRHLDVTLLRRKYHVTEVGVWGGPTRQATQSCDWLSKETHDDVSPPQGGGGDKAVPLLHATRQLVDPYRRLHPSLSPQAPDTKHSHQWLCWSHEVLYPLWGDRDDGPLDGWNLGPQVRRKTYYFFSDKVSMSPPLSPPNWTLLIRGKNRTISLI